MGSKKLLITGAVIAAVAATAILVPGVASGLVPAPLVPASSVVAPDDSPADNGRGNAWGHHKDSPDFPGNDGNGNGKAWGHHKDSPDFPGNSGNGDKSDDARNGDGKAWGHHKDSPDFPGNNGRGHDRDSDDG
jgi:hypothetical protein